MKKLSGLLAAAAILAFPAYSLAGTHPSSTGLMSPGLTIPPMDPAKGRKLFASKGCVVCHSVNGVGGEDAAQLDARFMKLPMNPFDFVARMWRGAPAMINAQNKELGAQIEFTGEELANIIAFLHDAKEQTHFTRADIPDRIRKLMTETDENKGSEEKDDKHSGKN